MADLDFGETIKGFSPGQKVFSRYALTRILGRGGMGVVWLARDEELEREVALKFLPEVVAADKEAVKELKRETRRSLELTHSHIVRIYDFVQDARTAAISMEYIAGDTLSSRKSDLDRGHFEPTELSAWVAQLCSALDYAHDVAQIVHRDLKPANLMVDARGHLKVADFGIATSISDSVSRVSKQAGSSGTPVYMSPQQMMGERPAVTDDIYALGATLYDLLSGKPPFYSGNIMVQVQGKVAPSITARRKELGLAGEPVPSEWEQTIAACLAKEPKDRPQSAGEIAERLGLAAKGNTQRPTSNAERSNENTKVERVDPNAPSADQSNGLGPSRSTSKTPLYAGLVAAVLALGGLGWYFGIHAPEQKRLAEIARLEAEKKTEEANLLRTQQERAAAEARARQEREAAAAKEQAEREQRAYAVIAARIDALLDGSPPALRAQTETAVRDYLAAAPERYRAEIETRWTDRQAGWETAQQKEQARLAAERLANARGGIAIRTNPAGAEVRVGAIALDKSPLTLKDQRLGKYPVRIRLDGYEEWTGEVEVKENEFADLDVALVRSTGKVVLTGTTGATVSVDGRTLGTLPLTLDRVPTGTVRYSVSHKDHKSVEVSGEVTRNVELRLSADLEKLRGPVIGQKWTIPDLALDLMPIAPGTFQMGSDSGNRDERPVTRVTLTRPYWMGKTEVTQAQWAAVMGGNPSKFKGDNLPVEQVIWHEAVEFCRKLTERERTTGRLPEGYAYTLPTEAQWEYACRAGTTGDYAGSLDAMGWYEDNSGGSTKPVGQKQGNAWGLHDMHGNVWEWCADWYGNYPGGSVTDPTGAASRSGRGLRGGSWQGRAGYCRSAQRMNWDQGNRYDTLGFRLALVPIVSKTDSVQTSSESPKKQSPEVGQKWTISDLALDLMPIAPGTFQMGSAKGARDDERPVTRVTLTKPFWLGKTEVTQAQWVALMGNNPSHFKGDSLPAQVTWDEAMEFCRKMTERERAAGILPEGYAYTLPTEAQWEYACRATTAGDYAGNLDAMGWYYRNSGSRPQPVGTKQANHWGLHDMHGNVFELCLDGYGQYPGGNITDAAGTSSGDLRILRGGSSGDGADVCRSAFRHYTSTNLKSGFVGFRLALSPVFPSASSAQISAESPVKQLPQVGQKWTISDLALDLMPIAPGTFQMGSDSGDRDERPVTRVTLTRPYWMGKTEVTQAQWAAVMGGNPSKFKGDNLPVERVQRGDAMDFCRRLTERERAAGRLPVGYIYTLPTEAQWEYACRAGTTGDYAGNLDAMGWYNKNSDGSTRPVGQKQANAWGLHDMHGNVWELCLDKYGKYPGGSLTDPSGSPSGPNYTARGGTWNLAAAYCRSTCRTFVDQGSRHHALGFRVSLTPTPH